MHVILNAILLYLCFSERFKKKKAYGHFCTKANLWQQNAKKRVKVPSVPLEIGTYSAKQKQKHSYINSIQFKAADKCKESRTSEKRIQYIFINLQCCCD